MSSVKTSNSSVFMVLDNVMDYAVDIYVSAFFSRKTSERKCIINANNISTINLYCTKYDKVNSSYFKITMTNGEILYINKYIPSPTGIFDTMYDGNPDYEKIEKLSF